MIVIVMYFVHWIFLYFEALRIKILAKIEGKFKKESKASRFLTLVLSGPTYGTESEEQKPNNSEEVYIRESEMFSPS